MQMILDIESLIPAHHVARVIDEMIEAIPDEQLFAHYTGGGPQFLPSENDAKSDSLWLFSKGIFLPWHRNTLTRKSSSNVASCDATA